MANELINDKPITTSIIERVTALLNLVVLCCCSTWLGLVGLFEWFMFSVCIVFFDIIVVMLNEVLLSKELKKKICYRGHVLLIKQIYFGFCSNFNS